jgi:hypothetical protein
LVRWNKSHEVIPYRMSLYDSVYVKKGSNKHLILIRLKPHLAWLRDRRGCDCMVAGFITTYAIILFATVPITNKVVSLNPTQAGCTRYNIMCQWLAAGLWFSPGTPVSYDLSIMFDSPIFVQDNQKYWPIEKELSVCAWLNTSNLVG